MKKNSKRYFIDYKYNGISYYTKKGKYTNFGIDGVIHCAHIVTGNIKTIKRKLKILNAFDVIIKEV